MKIHLSYSDRHFFPGKSNPHTEWFSCSQIAKHIWEVLAKKYDDVTYGDKIPDGPLDLLWTNRLCKRGKNVRKMATFASVAHYAFVARQVRSAKTMTRHAEPQGLYSLKERWQHWRTLATSDFILAIGNECINESFSLQRCLGKVQVIDCGIDTQHFIPNTNISRHHYFIHNATRFSARKGSHLIAQAWRKVQKKLPHASLLLLGKNGDVDIKQELLDVPNIIYIGEYQSGSEDYIKLLSQSKWVVLPSLAEGQAGTLLEAMSCGCVPIASSASGINAEEYGGYTVEPINVDSIASAMLKAEKEWDSKQSFKVREIVENRNAWNKFDHHVSTISDMLLSGNPRRLPSAAAVFQDFVFHFIRDVSKSKGAVLKV